MRTLTERSAVIHMFLLNCGLFLFLWSSIQQSCDLLGLGFVLRVKFSPKQVFNRIKKLLIRGFTVAAQKRHPHSTSWAADFGSN